MTKPVTIPNTFATATTAIPLSNLDADFSTVATAMNDANTYSNYAPDTGSANAYVVTLTGVSTAYSAGLRIQFKAGNANTTASTLNVNAQGAKNITYQDASAIASGTIAANSIVDVMYDGTQFLLMNDPAGGTGGDVVGPASATDNAIVRFDGATGKLVQNSVVTIADSTGDISGVGQLNATTVDTTNIEVTNIKAKDGTAAASIADSTGVVTVTAAPVMTALTASQAVFTTAGKALTSNAITGTGNVVMSASPTLTGTISAAAATLSGNLTLSGGTANGVLYLDGSKVATSGSALTFDGSLLSNTGRIKTATGSTGGSFDLGYASNVDSRSYRIQNDFNVYGDFVIAQSTTQTGTSYNALYTALNSGTQYWSVGGSEAMRLTSTSLYTASGINVGIGTSSPSYKLHIVGGNATGFLLDNGGQQYTQLLLQRNGTANTGGDILVDGSGSTFSIRSLLAGPMIFSTSATAGSAIERARITSGGYFKASNNGSYLNSTASYHETVSNVSNDRCLAVVNTNASLAATVAGIQITYTASSPNNTTNNFVYGEDSTAQRFGLRSNGGLANYQSNNVDLSDARTKKDITPAPSYWNKIAALEIVTYKYNDQTHDDINVGVIAQQVESVEPVWVDADGFGKTPEDGVPLKTVYTKDITFAAIKALQEAMARIETLEAKVAQLEGTQP
jgi:hypothetical protein